MVCVVAPQVVEYNWYLTRFGVYTQFQIAFVMHGSAVPTRYVAMVFYCVYEVFLK